MNPQNQPHNQNGGSNPQTPSSGQVPNNFGHQNLSEQTPQPNQSGANQGQQFVNNLPPRSQQPYQMGGQPQPTGMNVGGKKKSKKVLFGVIALIAVLILSGGAYAFAIYIPNLPQNVWKKGLNNSARVMGKLVDNSEQENKLTQFTDSEFKGSIKFDSASLKANGNLNFKYNGKDSSSNGDVSLDLGDGQNYKLSVEAITKTVEVMKFPDVYFKLSGLKETEFFDYFMPGIGEYDGKWILLSSEYFDSLPQESSAEDIMKFNYDSLTAQELSEVTQAIVTTSNDYLFSTDPETAVINQKEFTGKEDLDGVTAFRYKATLNKDNTIKFCDALVDNVTKTTGYKKIAGISNDSQLEESKKAGHDSCAQGKEEMNDDETVFDVWIDSKYKLITKVRVYDPEDSNLYADIGQKYDGGDDIEAYIDLSKISKDVKTAKVTLNVNFKDGSLKGEGNFESTGSAEEEKFSLNVKLESKPLEKLEIEVPKDAVKFEDVLQKLAESSANFESTMPMQDDMTLEEDVLGASSNRSIEKILKQLNQNHSNL